MVSTNVSIEWLDVPIVVSLANMSAQVLVSEGVDHLHESRRVLSQGQVIGARQRSPPFYQNLCHHSGFVDNVCLSMKKTMQSTLCSLSLWIKRL